MASVPIAAAAALRAAAESPRLEMLLHAGRNGHVRPVDAKHYASLSPRSGTGQYHVRALVDVGLLERAGRGRYRLTAAGALIPWLEMLLGGTERIPAAAVDVTLRGGPSQIDSLLPEGSELLMELLQRLPDGTSGRSAIRIARD